MQQMNNSSIADTDATKKINITLDKTGKSLKIKFIYLDWSIDPTYQGEFYEGLGSIMTLVKQAGHKISFLHVTQLLEDQAILDFVSSDTDLVAFSTTTNMFPLAKKWSFLLKEKYPGVPMLCGGNHPTLDPVSTLEQSAIDWCCVGEGEGFMLDLCDAINGKRSLEDIPNLAYRKGDANGSKITVNRSRLQEQNLDSIPVVDRTIFANHIANNEVAQVFTSRGCPYKCTFCCNEAKIDIYRGQGKAKTVRFFSPERVINELLDLKKANPKLKFIEFVDDVFAVNMNWIRDFAVLYKKHINLPFHWAGYPQTLNNERVELLVDMGGKVVTVGLQSGDDHIRSVVMDRKTPLKKMALGMALLKKHNVHRIVDIIFGVPNETKQQMIQTIEVLAELDVDHAKSHIFYPYPGTELFNKSVEMGLVDKKKFRQDYHTGSVLNYSKSHKRTILFMHLYSQKIVRILSGAYKSNYLKKTLTINFFRKIADS